MCAIFQSKRQVYFPRISPRPAVIISIGAAAAGALVAEKLDVADISYKKYIFNEKELIPDEKTLGSLMMTFSRDCDVIVAVGSGTLNDCQRNMSLVSSFYIICDEGSSN